jgi:hypothetical protein
MDPLSDPDSLSNLFYNQFYNSNNYTQPNKYPKSKFYSYTNRHPNLHGEPDLHTNRNADPFSESHRNSHRQSKSNEHGNHQPDRIQDSKSDGLLHTDPESRLHTLSVFKSPGDSLLDGLGHRVQDERQNGRVHRVGYRGFHRVRNHDEIWNG